MRCLLTVFALLMPLFASAQSPVAADPAGRALLESRGVPKGHPLQGFSSINARADGTYWALGDTGHGAQGYREDLRIRFHHVFIDWIKGTARVLSAQALRDPDGKLPFRTARPDRVLTPADLNVDAMQVLDTKAWFADDLGPLLIEADLRGRVLAAYAAPFAAAAVRRGFGGLSALQDGRYLYAAFEGALWSEGAWETAADGREYARILEFDLRERRFTARVLRYRFEANGHAIADLALIDGRTALVVERGPGFRRLFRVALDDGDARKTAFVDLREAATSTIEGLAIVEPWYIALSDGERREFLLLRSPAILGAP